MHIIVNGETENVSTGTIADYVRQKGLNPKALVVEHNGRVIVAAHWEQTPLGDGDKLELLSFVGGG